MDEDYIQDKFNLTGKLVIHDSSMRRNAIRAVARYPLGLVFQICEQMIIVALLSKNFNFFLDFSYDNI